MFDSVEKCSDVNIKHPVHFPARDSDVERVQCIVLATPRPKPIRKTQKVLLPDVVENRPYRVLDDLVFQRRDDQRELHLSPVRLWDGLKSAILFTRCAASASRSSRNDV